MGPVNQPAWLWAGLTGFTEAELYDVSKTRQQHTRGTVVVSISTLSVINQVTAHIYQCDCV